MSPRVLYIGGTGTISTASAQLALSHGIDLYLLNRGTSEVSAPEGAKLLTGDIRNPDSVRTAIADLRFDCVVDFVAFTPEHIETDIELFQGKASQYIFISSASAYRKPPGHLPVTESTFMANPYWEYSRNKIACEERLMQAFREIGFPATIVRPSHTYDNRHFPWFGDWTVIDRIKRGKPVVVHGDGTSLWTLTHVRDFAKGFNGLLANPNAVGEIFHITSDEALTWNAIHKTVADILGLDFKTAPVTSAAMVKANPDWEGPIFGDRGHSMVFDNAKIKRYVPGYAATIPFAHGAQEIVSYYLADPSRQKVDEKLDELFDKLIADQH